MPTNDVNRIAVSSVSRRKRAFPTTSSQRTWKIVSVVSLSASFVATVAFQQSSLLIHSRALFPESCSPTAIRVLTDPINLVKIESKQSVEDRATLEELYLLSSLAKKATRKKSSTDGESKQKKNSTTRTPKFEPKNNANLIELSQDAISTSTRAILEGNVPEKREIDSLQQHTSHNSTPSKKVRFKGLTTVPNRRNQKRKKTLVGSLSERIEINDDDYIRDILRKKEKLLSYDLNESPPPSTNVIVGSTSQDGNLKEGDSPALKIKKNRVNMVRNGLSSTMPGFREGKDSQRRIAYADGVKVAEKNPRIDFKQTAASKKKRARESGQTMYKTSNSVPDSLVQFANEIHDVDRITPEEEIELGEKTQEALRLQHIYDALVADLDREPTDDEWCAATGKFNLEAISQIIDEGLEAKNRLVTSNLRMVQGVVNVYIRNGLQGHYNAGDLMQEGILALIRAAEKFDPSRGFRFSTYAMYWIRSAIKRDQCSQSRIVQIPQRMHETHKRIAVNRNELTQLLNRQPTKSELSKASGLTVEQMERCETAISQKMYSLDQDMINRNNPIKMGDSRDTLASIVTRKADDADFNEHELHNLREDLLQALKAHLTEEESNILILKFGMDDAYVSSKKIGRSIAEVAEMVGFKPDKVRRIIKRSLTQLETLVGDDFRSYNRDFCI